MAVSKKPDVIVMDINMPGLICFDAARMITCRCPQSSLVFLSAFMHDSYIEQALSVGAAGYVIKSEATTSVIEAVRKAASGSSYYSSEVQARLVFTGNHVRLAAPMTRTMILSDREKDVLQYAARGMSNDEIAKTIHLSPHTVHRHITNLMNKLDLHSRVDLTRFAIREGLINA